MRVASSQRAGIGRLIAIGALVALFVACGGASSGSTPAAGNSGGSGTADSATQPPADDAATPPADDGSGGGADDGSGGGTDITDGSSIGDATKGTIKGEVKGDLSTTFELPLGAPLAVFDVAGDDSAYLPYTDGVTTVFLTFSGGQLLVQYAKEGTGITSGGEACTLNADDIDDGQVNGSFSCPNMMLISGESIGSVDMTANFDAHR